MFCSCHIVEQTFFAVFLANTGEMGFIPFFVIDCENAGIVDLDCLSLRIGGK